MHGSLSSTVIASPVLMGITLYYPRHTHKQYLSTAIANLTTRGYDSQSTTVPPTLLLECMTHFPLVLLLTSLLVYITDHIMHNSANP